MRVDRSNSGLRIKQPQFAVAYHFDSKADPELVARWHGEAAARLGLEGAVSKAQLTAVLEGRRPDGSGSIRRRQKSQSGSETGAPGFDIAFSAPKDVSLAYAFADRDGKAEIRRAHDQATAIAVDWLVSTGCYVKRGSGGAVLERAVPVAAVFGHTVSRYENPHLHNHVILANAGVTEDEHWGALLNAEVFRWVPAARAVYQAELRRLLAEEGRHSSIGRGGRILLHGATNPLVEAFSKTEAFRDEVEEMIYATKGSSEVAYERLLHKRRKRLLDPAELDAAWQERAAAVGAVQPALRDLGKKAAPDESEAVDPANLPPDVHSPEAMEVMLGPRGITEFSTTFTPEDLIIAWADWAPEGMALSDILELVDATLSHPEVVALDELASAGQGDGDDDEDGPRIEHGDLRGRKRAYTTRTLIRLESEILDYARRDTAREGVIVPEEIAQEGLARAFGQGLLPDQLEMVHRLMHAKGPVTTVVGVAGAGKTRALGAARQIWADAAIDVIGAAYTAKAASELHEGAEISSDTLASTVMQIRQRGLKKNSVVVVDEASMADTWSLHAVVAAAHHAGAHVVLVGDDRQLGAVTAGGMFPRLLDLLGGPQLLENIRQREEWEREALKALRTGHTESALLKYMEHGRLHLFADNALAMAHFVGNWAAHRQRGDNAAMWALTRGDTAVLNHLARILYEESGRLSGPALKLAADYNTGLPERTYQVGDEVQMLRNRRMLHYDQSEGKQIARTLENRMRGVITEVDVESGTCRIMLDNGLEVSPPADYLAASTDYAYCRTVHASQGTTIRAGARWKGGPKTKGVSLVFAADRMRREAIYVAGSRAVDETILYLSTHAPGEECEPPDARDLVAAAARAWRESGNAPAVTEEVERLRNAELLARSATPLALRALARRLRATLDSVSGAVSEDVAAAFVTTRVTDGILADEAAALCHDERAALSAEVRAAEEMIERATRRSHGAGGIDLTLTMEELRLVDLAVDAQEHNEMHAVLLDPPEELIRTFGPVPPVGDPRRGQWEALLLTAAALRHETGVLNSRPPETDLGSWLGWDLSDPDLRPIHREQIEDFELRIERFRRPLP